MKLPTENVSLSPDLEWMLQNDQISDEQLTGVLVQEQYAALYRFSWVMLEEPHTAEQVANETIRTAVGQRYKYWAHTSANAWIFAFAYKQIARRWYRTAFDWRASSHPVDLKSLSEEEAALDQFSSIFEGKQKVLFLLKYVFHFSVTEIAQVMGSNRTSQVQAHLDAARERLCTNLIPQANQNEDHTLVHRQIRQAADGVLDQEELNALGSHLAVCDGCRDYARNYAALEDRLKPYLQLRWNDPISPNETELAVVLDKICQQNGRMGRLSDRLPFTLREAGLVFAVIAVAFLLTWYSLLPEPDDPSREALNTAVVQMNFYQFTPTPENTPEAMAAQDAPASHAADLFNQLAAVKGLTNLDPSLVGHENPQVFLDFSHISLDPYTDRFQAGSNSSGSVNLAMMLKYWGWQGTIDATVRYLQPNSRDETVLYYELVNFINEGTPYRALWRAGGDVSVLEGLLEAGFPVMVQRIYWPDETDSWIGAYDVLTGFDQAAREFTLLPTYYPDRSSNRLRYDDLMKEWQAFNYSYLVVYPAADEQALMQVLGPNADEATSFQQAADLSSKEIYSTSGMAQIYAWFNRGTNLAYLNDYSGAAEAFREAFNLFSLNDGTGSLLVWRLLWYQTRPYWAFYYTGQYQQVILMANQVISMAPDRVIEESYYWRAMARKALGDVNGAVEDLNQAIQINPNFVAGIYLLQQIRAGN